MKSAYIETMTLVERLHRRFLDIVRIELERLGEDDINNVQSLILFHMGEEDVSVGELTARGYYLGTNVSYNLKKLVESGYVGQRSSERDRRSVRVFLTSKGEDLRARLDGAFVAHAGLLEARGLEVEALDEAAATILRLGRIFNEVVARPAPEAPARLREQPFTARAAAF
ncbi:MAG: MarR family transcriptional regulator [Rhodospirillaceae bacterium]|nr:MarR family transcriptional regulator [Rhodospirillaceae bacterium]MBT6119311.1 MarR family transcriptional regulator [Rhodospirillaceae bacterium]